MTRHLFCRRNAGPPRSIAAAALLAFLLPAMALPALAAAPTPPAQPRPQPELSVYLFKLRHQSAGDALNLVTPLLSPRGSVELRAGANTLVLRDSMSSLSRILPVLHAYDHPARDVQV